MRTDGEQCEGTTKEGDRCQNRAFAYIAVHNREGGHVRSAWLCGAHQKKACPPGGMIQLLKKWKRLD